MQYFFQKRRNGLHPFRAFHASKPANTPRACLRLEAMEKPVMTAATYTANLPAAIGSGTTHPCKRGAWKNRSEI
jgi:hypothetical protein